MISFKNLSKPSVDSELKLLLVTDTTELFKRKLIVEKVVSELLILCKQRCFIKSFNYSNISNLNIYFFEKLFEKLFINFEKK